MTFAKFKIDTTQCHPQTFHHRKIDNLPIRFANLMSDKTQTQLETAVYFRRILAYGDVTLILCCLTFRSSFYFPKIATRHLTT